MCFEVFHSPFFKERILSFFIVFYFFPANPAHPNRFLPAPFIFFSSGLPWVAPPTHYFSTSDLPRLLLQLSYLISRSLQLLIFLIYFLQNCPFFFAFIYFISIFNVSINIPSISFTSSRSSVTFLITPFLPTDRPTYLPACLPTRFSSAPCFLSFLYLPFCFSPHFLPHSLHLKAHPTLPVSWYVSPSKQIALLLQNNNRRRIFRLP